MLNSYEDFVSRFEIDYGGEQKFESDGGNTSGKEGEDEEEGEENDLHGWVLSWFKDTEIALKPKSRFHIF